MNELGCHARRCLRARARRHTCASSSPATRRGACERRREINCCADSAQPTRAGPLRAPSSFLSPPVVQTPPTQRLRARSCRRERKQQAGCVSQPAFVRCVDAARGCAPHAAQAHGCATRRRTRRTRRAAEGVLAAVPPADERGARCMRVLTLRRGVHTGFSAVHLSLGAKAAAVPALPPRAGVWPARRRSPERACGAGRQLRVA